MFELEIKEEANSEIIEAWMYYEEQQPGLGDRFVAYLEVYMDRIVKNPEHYPAKYKQYREATMKKFPFLVIYEITDLSVIVYSVFNTYKNPEKKP